MASIAYRQYDRTVSGGRCDYIVTDPAQMPQADNAKLKATEAYALDCYRYSLAAQDVDCIERTTFDKGCELRVLGEGQSLTLPVLGAGDITFGPGTVIETYPWANNFERITQVYDPATRCRYYLSDT